MRIFGLNFGVKDLGRDLSDRSELTREDENERRYQEHAGETERRMGDWARGIADAAAARLNALKDMVLGSSASSSVSAARPRDSFEIAQKPNATITGAAEPVSAATRRADTAAATLLAGDMAKFRKV